MADEARATYEDGILLVELPLADPREAHGRCRSGPPGTSRKRRSRDRGHPGPRRRGRRRRRRADDPARRAPGPPAEGDRRLPEHDDAAGRGPGALGAARQRRALPRPHARDGGQQGLRDRAARTGRRLPRRRRGGDRAHAEDARRHAADPRPEWRSACGSTTSPATEPYLVASIHEEPDVIELSSELEALTRHIQTTFSGIIEGVPYLPEELQVAIANVDDPEALGHMIAGLAADQGRGEAGAARGAQRHQAAAAPVGDPRPRAGGDGARLEDPVRGPERDGQDPARVLAARAAEGDSEGAGRGGRDPGRDQRAA